MTGCGFTYRHYRAALLAARGRYTFVSFETAGRPDAPERFIVLRHDVDYALEDALPLARLEAELGIAATFLVRPHAHYNPFGRTGFGILREIVAGGHHLGVHYDRAFYDAHGLPSGETVRREARRLAEAFGTPVAVASEHQPGRDPQPRRDLGGLLDAYGPEFTREIKYLSDSCQFWREGCFCLAVEAASYPRLQVLVHPEWWSERGARADEVLDRLAQRRADEAMADRRAEFRYYAGLTHLGNRTLFIREGD